MFKSFKKLIIIAICFLLFQSCKKEEQLFVLHKNTGITFKNTLTNTTDLNILSYLYYYNGAGVAAADFNNDGLTDIYFTSNQNNDALYLNKSGFKFTEVTETAGIVNKQGWTTGVTHVDINNDGLLDIYVCKVANYKNLKGHNLLFVNQGNNKDGIPVFKEEAAKYGLDFSGFATQATFFDYDLDGDLDMFLLNHSVHPNRTYGKGAKRKEVDWRSGDKLFKNNKGYFEDFTQQSGIFQGKIGYGLGVSTGDLNSDGYPDIYIGNDFFENDYVYINNQDGSFKELISNNPSALGHTTHYSMGNAMVDINNDGHLDIVSLDMLPEDPKTYKTSGQEYPYQTYNNYLRNGYAPQFMQNTLHLNLGNGNFSETAFASGIAATEWSWSPVAGDFNNDGWNDLYITNGIKGASNDMDYVNFIANENIQNRISRGLSAEDMEMINELPEKKTANYFFKNNQNGTFTDVTSLWFKKLPSFSNGSVAADLDNDGDLDLVVNNVNEPAFILENTLKNNQQANYLKIKFEGTAQNKNAIGAKVIIYEKGSLKTAQNYPAGAYLSALPPELHFGLGTNSKIDSVRVIWPNLATQKLTSVSANQTLVLKQKEATVTAKPISPEAPVNYLENTKDSINFKHHEYATLAFNRDPLIPFAYTNQGPCIAIADINNDGKDDFFIGGGKKQPSALFVQETNGNFTPVEEELFSKSAINEDTGAIFSDIDNDGDKDLLVVSGGNEFRSGKAIAPRIYINTNGKFTLDTQQFKDIFVNASGITTPDINNDGFPDICISSNQVPTKYGKTPRQYLFINDTKGKFIDKTKEIAPELATIGNVQEIIWANLNQDKTPDAIVVGHWMPVSVFLSENGVLKLDKTTQLNNTNGWWNTIKARDFDKDGDIDIIAGNWGLNTRLTANQGQPIRLYRNDFDDNGREEPIITYYSQNKETLFATKDELVKQLPPLNKKFLSYNSFAEATLFDFFPNHKIEEAYTKKVTQLASCYFENMGNGIFKTHPLPFPAQLSSIHDILIEDFNNDNYPDVLLSGNQYEVSTQLSRLDAMHGVLLLKNKQSGFTAYQNTGFNLSGPVRTLKKITINKKPCIIAGINNTVPVILQIQKK